MGGELAAVWGMVKIERVMGGGGYTIFTVSNFMGQKKGLGKVIWLAGDLPLEHLVRESNISSNMITASHAPLQPEGEGKMKNGKAKRDCQK